MHSKVFNLAQGYRLIFGSGDIWWRVVFRVGSKCTNIDFARRDGAVGVDLGNEDKQHEKKVLWGGSGGRTTTATNGS
jgi:hypothetical protein